jgi:phosphate-selective porin
MKTRLARWVGAAAALVTTGIAASASAQLTADDPLAGISDGQAFLRSADNNFFLFPSGRMAIDGLGFIRPTDEMPESTLVVRRARLEVAGWIGRALYYQLGGDFAAAPPPGADPRIPNALATTDDYLAFAPFALGPIRDMFVVQAGQFDAPFTYENRVSDKYTDFLERSLTVRSFAVPSNKEIGAMVHGTPPSRTFYYSLGVFNGDGPNFKTVDANLDVIGRAWIAPFQLAGIRQAGGIRVGGSFWVGERGADGLGLASGSTAGGFKFFDPKWTLAKTPAELHQHGSLRAFAAELDAPISPRFGLRFEYVHKTQQLDEDDTSAAASGKLNVLQSAQLQGDSLYFEAWGWIFGDARMLGEQGLQLPTRVETLRVGKPQHGLQVVARFDHLRVNVTPDGTRDLQDPVTGTTRVEAPALGLNYWYSKRFRASFNYGLNVIDGSTRAVGVAKQKNNGTAEQELSLRVAVAL